MNPAMENSPNYTADSYIPVVSNSPNFQSYNVGVNTIENRNKKKRFFPSSRRETCVMPWRKAASYSCGVIGLHEEINDFYAVMKSTDQETEIRLKVIEHITKTVHSLWPQAQVEIFGSFRTGLFLPSSDIDMVVLGEWRCLPLSTLSKALESRGVLNTDINIIANAKVPIIRLVHSPSKIRVDISFNKQNGIQSAKYIKNLIKEYPVLPKLVLVLKQFLIQRGLNEVFNGGMSSYCLTLLIVSFLQGYHKPKTQPSSNLGTLLIEFFEHYGINFNYEKVSIHFQNGGYYKPKQRFASTLSVEDPLDQGNDIAKGTFQMNMLRNSFQNAFHILSRAVTESEASKMPMDSFLGLILKIEEDVLGCRHWLLENHSRLMRTLSRLIANESPQKLFFGGNRTSLPTTSKSSSPRIPFSKAAKRRKM